MKPTLTQLTTAEVGTTILWGDPVIELIVKEQVVTVNGIEYVRDNGKGKESGLVLLAKDFGLEN